VLVEVGVESGVLVSSGGVDLSRPVILSDESWPLPLGLASVVIEMKRNGSAATCFGAPRVEFDNNTDDERMKAAG